MKEEKKKTFEKKNQNQYNETWWIYERWIPDSGAFRQHTCSFNRINCIFIKTKKKPTSLNTSYINARKKNYIIVNTTEVYYFEFDLQTEQQQQQTELNLTILIRIICQRQQQINAPFNTLNTILFCNFSHWQCNNLVANQSAKMYLNIFTNSMRIFFKTQKLATTITIYRIMWFFFIRFMSKRKLRLRKEEVDDDNEKKKKNEEKSINL